LRVGLLWRAEWESLAAAANVFESCKLRGVFAAFSALGVEAEPSCTRTRRSGGARSAARAGRCARLGQSIEQGRDRSQLDPLLREASEAGVWVSAHPDVILKMGTKEVLVDTQQMSWGTETHLYRSAAQLREQLAGRLAGKSLSS